MIGVPRSQKTEEDSSLEANSRSSDVMDQVILSLHIAIMNRFMNKRLFPNFLGKAARVGPSRLFSFQKCREPKVRGNHHFLITPSRYALFRSCAVFGGAQVRNDRFGTIPPQQRPTADTSWQSVRSFDLLTSLVLNNDGDSVLY